jgi:predicted metal-dependent peptidase
MDEAQKKLMSTASDLANSYLYYAPALEMLRFDRDDAIITLAINPKLVVFYNYDFVMSQTARVLRGIVLHEIMHFMSEHHKREINHPLFKTVSHILHNVAMDMEINTRIKALNDVELREEFVFPEKFTLPDGTPHPLPEGLIYENYLTLIIKALRKFISNPMNAKYIAQDGEPGVSIGSSKELSKDQMKGSLSKKGVEDVKQGEPGEGESYTPDTDNLVDSLRAKGEEKERSSGRGDGSCGSQSEREVQEQKYPWENIVRNVVMRKSGNLAQGHEIFTYKFYNKFNTDDIIKPVWRARKFKMNLCIIMDVSGSMYDIITEMYSKLKSIVHSVQAEIIATVLEVDTEVLNVIENFDLKSRTIKSTNGGGTDLRCAWDYIANKRLNPDLIICMSDGYTPWKQQGDANLMLEKTVCILSERSSGCPYRTYLTDF